MRPMEVLGRLYARRIVNVNVNIVVAGLLAMGLTIIPVWSGSRPPSRRTTRPPLR